MAAIGIIIIGPRSIVRRGMRRIIEDLGTHVTDPAIHAICDIAVTQWSLAEEAKVQAEIDKHKKD